MKLSDCTVLIVDDEPINIEILSEALMPHHKVAVATNGVNALKLVETKAPNIILLDVQMPELDGYEVCRQLKSNPKTKDIPVIFTTALCQDEDEVKGFELGAVDYITKPFHPLVVQTRVATQLKLALSMLEMKNLIDQTLVSSVRVLSDVLSMTNKTAIRHTHRIRRLTKAIAKDMKRDKLWQFEMAAQFSHLGCITIPEDDLHNIYSEQGPVSKSSQKIFDQNPDLSAKLIANIPRLEEVAIMLAEQRVPYSSDPKQDTGVNTQILRTAISFNALLAKGVESESALSVLRNSATPFPPDVLDSLERVMNLEADAYETYELPPEQINRGMILDEDVYSISGAFVASKDMEVDDTVLNLLLNRVSDNDAKALIRVRVKKR